MRSRACVIAALCCPALALAAPAAATDSKEPDPFASRRAAMVDRQIAGRGVTDSATLGALRKTPRHEFVAADLIDSAYDDRPLPIGLGQTISQPYVVAFMTELVRPRPGMKVLEVGTGSGYQAAVLAEAGCEVRTIEIFGELAKSAQRRLERLGYRGVQVRHGDGHFGWAEAAPFDAIVVTAAGDHIPPALVDQLKPGGRMVLPVGGLFGVQHLILVEKNAAGQVRTRSLLPVAFVPMLSGLR